MARTLGMRRENILAGAPRQLFCEQRASGGTTWCRLDVIRSKGFARLPQLLSAESPMHFLTRCRPPNLIAGAVALLLSVGHLCAAVGPLDDPVERAALPEWKVIPAAKPNELTPAAEIPLAPFARWTRSQGDNGARRYSTLQQITKENVRDLRMAWTYRSKDGAANVQCTPIVVDGVMYAPTPGRAIVAIDAATG